METPLTIVAMRRELGLSQAVVGHRVGRSQSVVSRWERGVLEPTIPDLVTLALVLDQPLLTVARLFHGPGRQRSRRGDPTGTRHSLAACVRGARHLEELDAWNVARRTAITPRRLHRIESGAQPSVAELIALAAVLPTLAETIMACDLTPM